MYDAGVRYEDLVGAAEAVVTKPGYGIISECIANDTACSTPHAATSPSTTCSSRKCRSTCAPRSSARTICSRASGSRHLDKLLAQPKPKKKPETNGADVAADILLKALDKPPRKPRGRPRTKV